MHVLLSGGIRYRKALDEGAVLETRKKNEGKRTVIYLVKREFKGTVTVEHAVKALIHAHRND